MLMPSRWLSLSAPRGGLHTLRLLVTTAVMLRRTVTSLSNLVLMARG
ncbi:MAG: hypothetical protein ACKV0T_25005 [Planctomycetales bacterium]